MSAPEGAGPGRRLTDAEEQQAAVLFAAGHSTRQVAAALGIGSGTAARLKQRLAARSAPASTSPEDTVTDHDDHQDDPGDGELAALRTERGAQASHVEGLRQREAVSRQAAGELDGERLRGLADGIADPALRERIANAQADAADWATAAELATAKLAGIDDRIAAVEARRELARLRDELAAAVAGRDAVLAGTGERQRICVQAVRAAAEGFVLALSDEQEATARVEQLAAAVAARATALGEPVPVVAPAAGTGLSVHPDMAVSGAPLALLRAVYRAREGNVEAVAVLLGECFGWLPPAPPTAEEIAAWQAREAEMARHRGPRQGRPWTRPDTASVGVDAEGRELRERPPVPPHPRDGYLPHAAAVTAGWLGGQPWPG
jgi:hypothetical protein